MTPASSKTGKSSKTAKKMKSTKVNFTSDREVVKALTSAYPTSPITDEKAILSLVNGHRRLSVPVEITPKIAEKLLGLNTTNRALRRAKASLYGKSMEASHWLLNGETICFAPGLLLNGQTRLTACVDSGVPFQVFLVVGLEEDVRRTIDTGTKRTFSDNLEMEGYGNSRKLSSAVTWSLRYRRGGSLNTNEKGSANVDYADMFDFIDQNPGIIEAAQWVDDSHLPSKLGLSARMYAGLIHEAHGLEDEAKEFLKSFKSQHSAYMLEHQGVDSKVYSGMALEEGHAAAALHRYITNRKQTPTVNNAALIRAFNLFVQGRDVERLRIEKQKKKDGTPSIRYDSVLPRIMTSDDLPNS